MSATGQGETNTHLSGGLRTLAKGTSLSIFGETGHIAITYAYGIVIARCLGANAFGIFFLGITIFKLVGLLSQCGIEDGLMRFLGTYIQRKEEHKAKELIRLSFLLALSLGVLLGGICFLSGDLLSIKIFHKPELAIVIRYLSLAIPISAVMTVSVASIRGFKIVIPYVLIRKIVLPLMSFVFGIVVLAMGYELKGLTMAYILALSCSAVVAFLVLRSFLSPLPKGENNSSERSRYFSFLGWAFLVNLLLFFATWNDLIILSVFRASNEVGIYFASKNTALLLSFFLISLNTIFVPVISHLHSGQEHNQLSRAYKVGTQWILMLGIPFFLVIMFFSREILSLFGPEFMAGQICLMILAFAQLINISVGSVGYLLMMTGKQKWMAINSIAFTILAIILTILLVPRYGLLGAAYANGASTILANIVALVETHFLLQLHPFSIRYFKILLSGAITAVVVYIVHCYMPNNVSIIFSLMQGSLVFIIFFVLVILFALEEDEKKFLMAIKGKFLQSRVQASFGFKK